MYTMQKIVQGKNLKKIWTDGQRIKQRIAIQFSTANFQFFCLMTEQEMWLQHSNFLRNVNVNKVQQPKRRHFETLLGKPLPEYWKQQQISNNNRWMRFTWQCSHLQSCRTCQSNCNIPIVCHHNDPASHNYKFWTWLWFIS